MHFTSSILKPRLEVKPGAHGRVVNTSGDLVDSCRTVLVPKSQAQLGRDGEGQDVVEVGGGCGPTSSVPRSDLQEGEGPNGAYYLPSYKDSKGLAAFRGGMRGLTAFNGYGLIHGVAGGVAGVAGGLVGSSLPIKNNVAKVLVGAATGMGSIEILHQFIHRPASLPVTLTLGALAGATGTLGGAGQARIRDGLSAGSLLGTAAALVTHDSYLAVAAGTAAAIGIQARSPGGRAVASGAVGALLGAFEAVLTHNSVGMASAVVASAAALGSFIGPPVLQASRNLQRDALDNLNGQLGNWSERQSERTLKFVGAVPGAISGALLGGSTVMLHPALLVPGLAVGATLGAVGGALEVHHVLEASKEQAHEAARIASENSGTSSHSSTLAQKSTSAA